MPISYIKMVFNKYIILMIYHEWVSLCIGVALMCSIYKPNIKVGLIGRKQKTKQIHFFNLLWKEEKRNMIQSGTQKNNISQQDLWQTTIWRASKTFGRHILSHTRTSNLRISWGLQPLKAPWPTLDISATSSKLHNFKARLYIPHPHKTQGKFSLT